MAESTVSESESRVRGAALLDARETHPDRDLRTQQGLATRAGISTRTLARAEAGNATFHVIEKIAAALGVPAWDFWIPMDARFDAPIDRDAAPAPARNADVVAEDVGYIKVRLDLMALDVAAIAEALKVDLPSGVHA